MSSYSATQRMRKRQKGFFKTKTLWRGQGSWKDDWNHDSKRKEGDTELKGTARGEGWKQQGAVLLERSTARGHSGSIYEGSRRQRGWKRDQTRESPEGGSVMRRLGFTCGQWGATESAGAVRDPISRGVYMTTHVLTFSSLRSDFPPFSDSDACEGAGCTTAWSPSPVPCSSRVSRTAAWAVGKQDGRSPLCLKRKLGALRVSRGHKEEEESVLSLFGLAFAMWDLMIQSFSKKPQEHKQFDETQRKGVHAQTATECRRLCGDPP